MKKKSIIIKIAAIFLAVFMSFGFTFTGNVVTVELGPKKGTASAETSQDTKREIETAGDFLTLTQDSTYNSLGAASAAANRKRLVIKENTAITLSCDVVMTADASLDLNGNTLDLAGFNLIIRHNYVGSYLLVNGNIKSGTGKLVIQTPNAHWTVTANDFESGNPIVPDAAGSVQLDSDDREAKLNTIAEQFAVDQITKGGFGGAYYGDILFPRYFGSLGSFQYTTDNAVLGADGKTTLSDTDGATDQTVKVKVQFVSPYGTSTGQEFAVRMLGKAYLAKWQELIETDVVARLGAIPSPGESAYQYTAQLTKGVVLPVSGYFPGEIAYTCSSGATSFIDFGTGSIGKTAFLNVDGIKEVGGALLAVAYGGVTKKVNIDVGTGGGPKDPIADIIRAFFEVKNATRLEFTVGASKLDSYSLKFPDDTRTSWTTGLQAMGLEEVKSVTFKGLSSKAFEIRTNSEGKLDKLAINAAMIAYKYEYGTIQFDMEIKDGTDSGGNPIYRTEARDILLYYASEVSDTVANPALFATHIEYFRSQFRQGTHDIFEMDAKPKIGGNAVPVVEVDATKMGKAPFVAFRILNPDGSAYTKAASAGGIDLKFKGTDGVVYTPVWNGAVGTFSGLQKAGASTPLTFVESMTKFVKTVTNTETPVWQFIVDPEKRNRKLSGVVDESLELQYQYTFAQDFTKSGVRFFRYGSGDESNSTTPGAFVPITTPFTLMSLSLCGTSDTQSMIDADNTNYDFDNATLYDKVKNAMVPGYYYIPLRALRASREELNVKLLLYPNGDKYPTGDSYAGKERDSVATDYVIKNWGWLELLVGLNSLNLHGMHIDDSFYNSTTKAREKIGAIGHIEKLTQLTRLDISGVIEPRSAYLETISRTVTVIEKGNPVQKTIKEGYNEGNADRDATTYGYPNYYSSQNTDVGDIGLGRIADYLKKLKILNVSFCKIRMFDGLCRLSDTISECYIQGNDTGKILGYAGIGDSIGSCGAVSAFAIYSLAAQRSDLFGSFRCKIYRRVNDIASDDYVGKQNYEKNVVTTLRRLMTCLDALTLQLRFKKENNLADLQSKVLSLLPTDDKSVFNNANTQVPVPYYANGNPTGSTNATMQNVFGIQSPDYPRRYVKEVEEYGIKKYYLFLELVGSRSFSTPKIYIRRIPLEIYTD